MNEIGSREKERILLRCDNRVSFQRDTMWHFNALFQPAKCLICKTRSRSGTLLRRACLSPPRRRRLLSALSPRIPPSLFIYLSLFLPFCFWYLLPPIGSRQIQLSCRLSWLLLLLQRSPLLPLEADRGTARRYTEHFSLFRSRTTR